jgi:hypothetical protein
MSDLQNRPYRPDIAEKHGVGQQAAPAAVGDHLLREGRFTNVELKAGYAQVGGR